VSRQASNVGYGLDSLMRASSVVICQLKRQLGVSYKGPSQGSEIYARLE